MHRRFTLLELVRWESSDFGRRQRRRSKATGIARKSWNGVSYDIFTSSIHTRNRLTIAALVLHQGRDCRRCSVGTKNPGAFRVHGRDLSQLTAQGTCRRDIDFFLIDAFLPVLFPTRVHGVRCFCWWSAGSKSRCCDQGNTRKQCLSSIETRSIRWGVVIVIVVIIR